ATSEVKDAVGRLRPQQRKQFLAVFGYKRMFLIVKRRVPIRLRRSVVFHLSYNSSLSFRSTSFGLIPLIFTTLFLLVEPEMSETLARGRSKSFARKRINSSLASPSTGGAATQILIAPSSSPATPLFDARG